MNPTVKTGYHIESQDQAIDLVCGMNVSTENNPLQTEYKGTIYYFCSPGCKEHFDIEPEMYVD